MSEDHPEKVSPKDSEDVAPEDSEWVSVGDLLRRSPSRDPVPVALLATALEKFSCYEIDRFGRQVSTKEYERVLNMVAQWNELENYTPSGHHPDTDPGWILEELDRFGWPRANVPDFDSMKPGAEEPLGATDRRRMQRAIVGLVALGSDSKPKYKKPSGPSIDETVMSDTVQPSPPDFSPYLDVTHDGYIWWLREDAIRLGAGFSPFSDDHDVLQTELRAPNNRALVNERTLIGAFGGDRLNIAKPITFERDGFRYVDAAGFLTWLSEYLCRTQAKIEFPDELFNAVRVALAKAGAERPPSAPEEFESLALALEEQFDKPLDALPDELRHQVDQEFLVPWDALAPAQRRSVALQWDYQNSPATWEDRQFWWNFHIKRDATKKQISEWETAAAPTAGDLALKEDRLADLRQELALMDQQEREARGDDGPETADLPGVETKTRGHLNHDPIMQRRANEIAAERKKVTKRTVTRDEVGKLLAQKLGMGETTVIRRIRKQW